MAILSLSLVTSILRPHKPHLSFLFTTKPNPILLQRRRFTKTVAVSTSSTAHQSSLNPNSDPIKKASVPTFQQAIQRLQVWLITS